MPSKRVLIIDDEQELCELLRIAFESRQYKVFTAYDGEEGLKAAKARKPDAIVLDIKMPGVNGYEFLNRLRKDETIASIPIVVLTSITESSSRTDEDWARSLEVSDFLSKPVEPFTIVERVNRLFGPD